MSRRTRLVVLVALSTLVAVAVVVAGALLQVDEEQAAEPVARAGDVPPPPLELDVYPGEPRAEALQAAERAYDAGRLQDAAEGFEQVLTEDPDSLPAAVGAALAAWPDGTLERLQELAQEEPASALVRLHLGLALSASGDDPDARREWELAVTRDPDTPAAVRADSLLHPDIAPGLPFFVPPTQPPEGIQRLDPLDQVAVLRERAGRGEAADYLLLGAVLQRLGRPVSAAAAFESAAALEPGNVEAQVAAAVGRFDKDDPSRAFSALGPLSRQHSDAAAVRFHLGVMLLWIRALDEARRQLAAAVEAEPESVWGREAQNLLTSLSQQ